MMPTTMAIVTATFPPEKRGRALGLMAGASAFFAALGPVLGLLTEYIDRRAVLLVNVPLAAITIGLTLWAAPAGALRAGAPRSNDWPGVAPSRWRSAASPSGSARCRTGAGPPPPSSRSASGSSRWWRSWRSSGTSPTR
jgi:MFS family permease